MVILTCNLIFYLYEFIILNMSIFIMLFILRNQSNPILFEHVYIHLPARLIRIIRKMLFLVIFQPN